MSAAAHHSYTEFDSAQTIEIEGQLLNVVWQNPHAHIEVQTAGPDGSLVTWEIESPVSTTCAAYRCRSRYSIVGSRVKVAGWPSKRSGVRLYGTNILSADGQEFVLWRSKPRWADTAHGYVAGRSGTGDSGVATVASAATIFRVWASVSSSSVRPDDPDASPQSLSRVPLPLTPAAQAAVAAFNPVEESTAHGCTPKGMPDIMNQPFPIEFVDQGDTILLRIEEYDSRSHDPHAR